jgi:hypothetical protein
MRAPNRHHPPTTATIPCDGRRMELSRWRDVCVAVAGDLCPLDRDRPDQSDAPQKQPVESVSLTPRSYQDWGCRVVFTTSADRGGQAPRRGLTNHGSRAHPTATSHQTPRQFHATAVAWNCRGGGTLVWRWRGTCARWIATGPTKATPRRNSPWLVLRSPHGPHHTVLSGLGLPGGFHDLCRPGGQAPRRGLTNHRDAMFLSFTIPWVETHGYLQWSLRDRQNTGFSLEPCKPSI